MGNSLRCCLACVIPCGALDVIRIVHLDGQVEELTRSISAAEVLNANPNHSLSNPSSQLGVVRKTIILSPESELKRGNIYFLIPSSSVPAEKKKSNNTTKTVVSTTVAGVKKIGVHKSTTNDDHIPVVNKEVPEEKKTTRHRRRTSAGRASRDWKPHLESIYEDSRQYSIPNIMQ